VARPRTICAHCSPLPHHPLSMPKQAATITDDDTALAAVCGGEAMADRVKALWADIMEKKRLDVSDQGLDDDGVMRLLKGLHMCVASPAS
jgi:hypothetical protein